MQRLKKYNFTGKALALFSLLFVLFTSSCENVVDVNLETADPKLVIDAEIIWKKGTSGNEQTIKISRMAPYYSPKTPKVSGAKVRVENSQGTSFTFNESEPGVYICTNFVPVINMDYVMFVEVNGETYTAAEKLTSVVPISDIEQKMIPDIGGEDIIELTFYYKDPIDEVNYYLTDYKSDFLLFNEYVIANDELFNGNVSNTRFSDKDMKPGKKVEIIHRGISKNFYSYMDLILKASTPNPFATLPANIRGNFVNTTNKDNFALGYFRLCEASATTYVVK